VKKKSKFPSVLNTTPAFALIAPCGDLYASQCEDITNTSEDKKKQKLNKDSRNTGKGYRCGRADGGKMTENREMKKVSIRECYRRKELTKNK